MVTWAHQGKKDERFTPPDVNLLATKDVCNQAVPSLHFTAGFCPSRAPRIGRSIGLHWLPAVFALRAPRHAEASGFSAIPLRRLSQAASGTGWMPVLHAAHRPFPAYSLQGLPARLSRFRKILPAHCRRIPASCSKRAASSLASALQWVEAQEHNSNVTTKRP